MEHQTRLTDQATGAGQRDERSKSEYDDVSKLSGTPALSISISSLKPDNPQMTDKSQCDYTASVQCHYYQHKNQSIKVF